MGVDDVGVSSVDEVELPSVITFHVTGNSNIDAVIGLWNILSERDDGRRPVFEVDEVDGELGCVGIDRGPGHTGGFTLCNGGVESWGKDGVCGGRGHQSGEGEDLGEHYEYKKEFEDGRKLMNEKLERV